MYIYGKYLPIKRRILVVFSHTTCQQILQGTPLRRLGPQQNPRVSYSMVGPKFWHHQNHHHHKYNFKLNTKSAKHFQIFFWDFQHLELVSDARFSVSPIASTGSGQSLNPLANKPPRGTWLGDDKPGFHFMKWLQVHRNFQEWVIL